MCIQIDEILLEYFTMGSFETVRYCGTQRQSLNNRF